MKLFLISRRAAVTPAEFDRMSAEDKYTRAMAGEELESRIVYDKEADALEDWEDLGFYIGAAYPYSIAGRCEGVELICHGLYDSDGRLLMVSDFDTDRINADCDECL